MVPKLALQKAYEQWSRKGLEKRLWKVDRLHVCVFLGENFEGDGESCPKFPYQIETEIFQDLFARGGVAGGPTYSKKVLS